MLPPLVPKPSMWDILVAHLRNGDLIIAHAILEQFPGLVSTSVNDGNLLHMVSLSSSRHDSLIDTMEFPRATKPASIVEVFELVRAHVADDKTWRTLLEGPDEGTRHDKGRPIDWAIWYENEPAVDWLANRMNTPWENRITGHRFLNDPTPLHIAVTKGMLGLCKRIVRERPESVLETTILTKAVLTVDAADIAVMCGHHDVYRFLRGVMPVPPPPGSSTVMFVPRTPGVDLTSQHSLLGSIVRSCGSDCTRSQYIEYMARCGVAWTGGFVARTKRKTMSNVQRLEKCLVVSSMHAVRVFLFGCRVSSGSEHLWKIGNQYSMGCIRRAICDYAFDVMLPHERRHVQYLLKTTLGAATRRVAGHCTAIGKTRIDMDAVDAAAEEELKPFRKRMRY